MWFRLLGPLEVEDERGVVPVTAGRESALLALLLIHAGHPLATDRIVEELWGERAPANATKSVQVYVSRLRKSLGAARIETTAAGYRVRVETGELDSHSFEEHARGGRLQDALGLWRGPPLEEFRYAPFAQGEARRLEEIHDGVLADRVDQRLDAGEGTAVIAELDAAVSRNPLWERPRAQLMRALYLAGRQADALALYRSTRETFADELGVEPSPELQRLEHAILNHDPTLGTPARPTRKPATRRGRLLVLAGGLLICSAAVTAAAVIATRGGTSLITIESNAVGVIDAHSGRIVAQIGVGDRPSRLAVAGGRLWALNSGDGTISEIDTHTNREVGNFGPSVVPAELTATPGAVWVGTASHGLGLGMDGVARFDVQRHAALGTVTLPTADSGGAGGRLPDTRELAATPDGVWAIAPSLQLVELDLRSGAVRRTVPDVFASALAYGAGRLWAVSGFHVIPIDPKTGRVGTAIRVPSLFYLGGVAVGGGSVWVTSPGEGVVWQIEVRVPHRITTVDLAYGASAVTFAQGDVWVANRYDGGIERIDPRTTPPRVTRVASVPAPQDIVSDGSHVFVAAGARSGRRGALTAQSCGPVDYQGPGSPDVLIASDLPLEGQGSEVTAAAVATIHATLSRRGYRAGRYRVGYQSCDDATASAGGFDDGQCSANATAYADDQSVIGVVGTYDSECAQFEIPVLNRAPHGPLALISPFNTGPFLTRRGVGDAYKTLDQFYAAGPRNYVRTIGADHIQVAAAATFAQRLHLRRVAVLYDTQGMEQQMQERWFLYAAKRLGLTAIPIDVDTPGSLQTLLNRAHADGAFLVSYVLGVGPATGTPILAALAQAFPAKPVLVTDVFPSQAAAGNPGRFYASDAGIAVKSLLTPTERRLLAALPSRNAVPYAIAQTAPAVDDLLTAIAHSNGTRRSVVERLRATPGLDRWGDPATAPVTILHLPATGRPVTFPDFPRREYVTTVTPSRKIVPPG
jgi:DNA-binding SARP family transcriptional activator/ABC-type branched-subunit amino acid transport system substrate-binding protein